MEERAFSGLKVLDCTQGVAGPYCTKLLADFGAEVMKVEPLTGDSTRNIGPFLNDDPHPEKSGTFFYLNTNKKSVTLNLESDAGVKIFIQLAREVDLLVENYTPGKMAELGLSYESLKAINPHLVFASISPFGQTGPYRDYKATNLTVSGLGGAMYTMRPGFEPSERPVVAGGYQAEYTTGVLGFIAVVAALMKARETGVGEWLDIAEMECVASSLMGNLAEYSYLGLSRKTNPYPIHGYPQGDAVACKDGWISLTPGIGGAPNIAFLIERPELAEDPLLTEPRTRMAEPGKFDALIAPWLKEHSKWEITRAAQELRLAFTPVLSAGELLDDEQIKAREYFTHANHPVMGDVIYPGAPAKLSESPWQPGKPPLLGEHNDEIYKKLGYDKSQLDELKSNGII